jgi:hypothetical protein
MDNKRKIGEEELKRALLMMKYDSKKTLTENVQEVEGVQRIDEVAWFVPAAWGLGKWLLATAVTGGAIAGISSWIDSVTGGGDSFDNTKIFFEGCSTISSKMKPNNSPDEIKKAADIIWTNSAGQDWYQGFGASNEESIKKALDSMETIADLCALNSEFYKTYSRDLFEVLDSEIDGDDFTTYVWAPISRKAEQAKEDLDQAESQQQDSTTNTTDTADTTDTTDATIAPSPSTGRYKECSGTYTQGCFSEKIREVQTCLGGLVPDGKFGPKTQAALDAVGFGGGFKDSDVNKICSISSMPEPDSDLPTPDEDDIDSLN